MCPVYGPYVTSILREQQYVFGIKNFLTVEKLLLMRKETGHHVVLMTDSIDSVIHSDL